MSDDELPLNSIATNTTLSMFEEQYGPEHVSSYACGFAVGYVHGILNARDRDAGDTTLARFPAVLLKYADIMAMAHGYTLTTEASDDEGGITLRFSPNETIDELFDDL